MAQLLPKVLFDLFDANGAPVAGGKLFFYASGTTTDAPVYADEDLSTPHPQPVVANSAGRFPAIFLDEGAPSPYRVKIKDADDALIADYDPINAAGSVGAGQLQAGAVTEPKLGDGAVSHRALGVGVVANENTANMAAAKFKGRAVGAVPGPMQDLTAGQAAAILGLPGMIAAFAMATAPDGWLECDGSAVSRVSYAALFAAIGTTWGAGDGTTTFNLPDLRGEFLRGWDHGKGTDSGRTLGSSQADDFKSHGHDLTLKSEDYDSSTIALTTTHPAADAGQAGTAVNTSAAIQSAGGSETRPRNLAVLYAIRA